MTREELAQKIYDCSHLTGTFTLRSGVVSNEYFDKYQFESQPDVLFEIAKQIIPLMPADFDLLAGLEMGGIPIATAIAYHTKKPIVFVRKKSKGYGTDKVAEGPDLRGRKVVIIEDVVTSGGQIVLSTADLTELGADVSTAVCVIDRQSGGPETLSKIGLELKSLFTMSDIKAIVKK